MSRKLTLLFLTVFCGLSVLHAQTLRKIEDHAEYEIYELRNDSLFTGNPFELTISVSPNQQAYQILEQKITQVNAKSSSNVFTLKPLIEVLGSGVIKKQEVTRIKIYQSRRQGSVEYITEYAKIKVFKTQEPIKKAGRFTVTDHPFATGKWLKIEFVNQGIYEITPAMLQEAGISTTGLDPRNIQVWALSGEMIPERNSAITDNFSQIPIHIVGESDGVFQAEDRIYFYGNSAYKSTRAPRSQFDDEPVFRHSIHHYATKNVVFLTVGTTNGLRMATANSGMQANQTVSQYQAHIWKEDELHKTEEGVRSGRQWLGQLFTTESFSKKQTILIDTLPGFVASTPVKLSIRFYARASANSTFTTFLNNQSVGAVQVMRVSNLNDATGSSANLRDLITTIPSVNLTNSVLQLEADFGNTSQGATGWVDFIDVEFTRQLVAERDYLEFFPPAGLNGNQPVGFMLSGFSKAPIVLDASNAKSPFLLQSTESGTNYQVNYFPDPYKRLIAQATFYKPTSIKELPNQNISGTSYQPDYIVITTENLLEQANRLAQYRQENDGLRPLVVTQENVFNEFSGGVPDIMALRLVGKHFYDRATSQSELPRYVLLFGDTSFDYKGIESNVSMQNLIFTYQSSQSIVREGSFGSDDFFALFDPNEGSWASTSELIDVGIGRLPVQTASEARAIVDKIIHYESAETDFGDWRTLFTFAADDDFPDPGSNKDLHLLNADSTAAIIDLNNSGIKLKKIYFFDYPVENTAGGRRYPQATRDFLNTINTGTLVTNYSGHGAEQVLADERFFVSNMIPELTNYDRLTVLVTATCSFGRFDDNQDQSGAEKLVLSDKGGAIAAFTTTRVVFTSSSPNSNNFGLNRALTLAMSTRESGTNLPKTFGDIYQQTKTTGSVGPSENSRRFILLGDPAIRLKLPKREMRVTQINTNDVGASGVIGINSLEEVSVSGEVIGSNLALDAGFNGEVLVQVRDARRFVRLPAKETWGTFSNGNFNCYMPNCGYFNQNDILFNGRATVTNGQFTATFILPKDLGFSGGVGKILLYATDGSQDATGAFSRISVTGLNTNANNDGVGPQMEIFLNDEQFVQGVIVNNNPELIVKLDDPSGINSAASGVGHEIIAKIKKENFAEETVVLNEYFTTDLDNYKKGEIRFPFQNLEDGDYSITVRAWDIFNNPSEQSTFFTVTNSNELVIKNVYNYPNPFNTKTKFVLEHNQPNNPISVLVKVYTLTGRPVLHINEPDIVTSSPFIMIDWDGRDKDGDRLATGTYLYHIRVQAETSLGKQTKEIIEKLVIIN